MKLQQILNYIQKELKAPKGQINKFGNYKYRSCEDILEAVKPLLQEAILTIYDEIVLVGDRYYVKATAIIATEEGQVQVSAFARESLEKKGMDTAQITGATSSYARKYALNGLFCIDDTKDADTQKNDDKDFTETVYEEAELVGEQVKEEQMNKVFEGSEPIKTCPLCGKEHQGKYPKCLDCWKAEQNGETIVKKVRTKKLINPDVPPFDGSLPANQQ